MLSNFCSAIGTAIQKIPNEVLRSRVFLERCQLIMELFMRAMQEKDSIIQEEIIMAISSIVRALEEMFDGYAGKVLEQVLNGLNNSHEQPMLCKVAVGLIGDVATHCPNAIQPKERCDTIVHLLLQCLIEPHLLVTVKPDIIACIADIALAIGGDIERYFKPIMHLLLQAGTTTTQNLDPEVIETVYRMRENILTAFCSILNGLRDRQNQAIFIQHTDSCIEFIKLCLSDNPDSPEGPSITILCETLNFVADFFRYTAAGPVQNRFTSEPWFGELLKRCQTIGAAQDSLKMLARLAQGR